jgi:hypothetical protein
MIGQPNLPDRGGGQEPEKFRGAAERREDRQLNHLFFEIINA